MSVKYIDYDQSILYLLPPSLQDWLLEDHLARFVAEIVEQLDLGSLKKTYAGRGSQPYNPEMLLALLFERRAVKRYAREKEAYDKNQAGRAEKETRTGKKPGGREPKPAQPGTKGKDQVNLTDGESASCRHQAEALNWLTMPKPEWIPIPC